MFPHPTVSQNCHVEDFGEGQAVAIITSNQMFVRLAVVARGGFTTDVTIPSKILVSVCMRDWQRGPWLGHCKIFARLKV